MKKATIISTCVFIIIGFIISCGSDEIGKAKNLISIKAYDQAVQLLEKVIQDSPKNARAHFMLANAYAFKAINEQEKEFAKKAISSYNSAALLKPDNPAVFYNLGAVQNLAGEQTEAIENLNKSLELRPDNYGAMLLLSQIFKGQRNEEKAEKYFSDAVKLIRLQGDKTRLKYLAKRDSVERGTFIVKHDSVQAWHEVYGRSANQLLAKYDIRQFHSRKGDTLVFTDRKNPVFEPRLAYGHHNDFEWLYRWVDRNGFNQDRIPIASIKPGSIKELRFLGWGRYEFSYEEILYCNSRVYAKDVAIGSGKVQTDMEFVAILQKETNLTPDVKKMILEGYIQKGMPLKLVELMFGNLNMKEFLPGEENIVTLYANDLLEFRLIDGCLESWFEKEPQ